MNNFEKLKENGEIPEWADEASYLTLSRGYLLENETPKGMYKRLAKTASEILKRKDLEDSFFNILWEGWLCPSSPVCSNFGADRALPISCFSSVMTDSTIGIFDFYKEIAMLTKNGGGCGAYWGDIRGRGTPISGGGASEGIVGWLKIVDQVMSSVSQNGLRRGAIANYLPVSHLDIEEFISIRRQIGDESRKCRGIGFHHGITIDDEFMNSIKDGNIKNRKIWSDILTTRWEMGEPYLMFSDTANNNKPEVFKDKPIVSSNLCNEIFLPSDENHTFVCCLSSLNLTKYDEWKNTNLVELSIYFLDAVMEEFLQKSKNKEGLEKAYNFAIKSRALGLGVLGYHTYLQQNQIPFDSFDAMRVNNEIFKLIDNKSLETTKKLAIEYGEPEWCKGYGVRNATRIAIAPTLSNSVIAGGYSEGIQPYVSNVFAQKTAKGVFLRKNKLLEKILEERGKNTPEIWDRINTNKGSVKNLVFLTDEEKEVFKTAREINQFALVRQAGQRQKYIDQGQSLNLFFSFPNDYSDKEETRKIAKYVHDVHMEAWELGVKGLYYLRTESALKGDSIYYEESDCKACEA